MLHHRSASENARAMRSAVTSTYNFACVFTPIVTSPAHFYIATTITCACAESIKLPYFRFAKTSSSAPLASSLQIIINIVYKLDYYILLIYTLVCIFLLEITSICSAENILDKKCARNFPPSDAMFKHSDISDRILTSCLKTFHLSSKKFRYFCPCF